MYHTSTENTIIKPHKTFETFLARGEYRSWKFGQWEYKKQVADASRKTAVCSRSVANCFHLTIHRPKNRKVVMHHTQGVWGLGVFFVYGGLRLRNGAVNDQRQGIITAMVSCLFALQKGACVVRAWPLPARQASKNSLVSNKVFHCISRKSVFQ